MASFSALQLRLQAETIRSYISLGQNEPFSSPPPSVLAILLANSYSYLPPFFTKPEVPLQPPVLAVARGTFGFPSHVAIPTFSPPVSAVYTAKTVTRPPPTPSLSPKREIPLQPPVLAVARGISGSPPCVATSPATSSTITPPPVLAVAKTVFTSPPPPITTTTSLPPLLPRRPTAYCRPIHYINLLVTSIYGGLQVACKRWR